MDEPVPTAEETLVATWSRWFTEAALPFWRQHGWHETQPLAFERLHLDGTPDGAAPLRVRTQARQAYTYAHAVRLGLDPAGAAVARRTLTALHERACRPDGRPGWVHVLTPDGSVLDARRDLYDHAFILLMLGHARAAGIHPEAGRWLEATLADIETVFAADHGGFAETAEGGLPRRQNPHMHLFEAMLALFELTGEERFMARAGELYGLFRSRWLDAETCSLREFFADDWSHLPDGRSDVLEPGHHMEWVWLLRRYEHLARRPLGDLPDRLFRRGEALGLVPEGAGFLVDESDWEGRPRRDSRRLWPQTEYLKALIVQARAHRDAALWQRAVTLSERVFAAYLAGVPDGTWSDRFTIGGTLAVDHIPASTLYHLFGVLVELVGNPQARRCGRG